MKQIDEQSKSNPNLLTGQQCWTEIQKLTVKTIIACHQGIAHSYRSAKPQDTESSLCFQILGFDIFIDHKARPWLIEVNQSPSFQADSPLDQKIKLGVLSDAVKILSLSLKRKLRYLTQIK